MQTKLKVIYDSPTAVIPGHVIKIDNAVERPVGIISQAPDGREFATQLVHRYNTQPETLEALKAAHSCLEEVLEDTEDYVTGEKVVNPLLLQCRAAIANAEFVK